jgi:hypothetical protein
MFNLVQTMSPPRLRTYTTVISNSSQLHTEYHSVCISCRKANPLQGWMGMHGSGCVMMYVDADSSSNWISRDAMRNAFLDDEIFFLFIAKRSVRGIVVYIYLLCFFRVTLLFHLVFYTFNAALHEVHFQQKSIN